MTFRFGSRNKYRAKPTNGYPSKLEAAVGDILLLREKCGEIRELKRQQQVVLQDGPREERITWRLDFSFFEIAINDVAYAEAKGIETSDYKLKLKMWRKQKPAKLYIYKGNYRNPKVVEVIEPKERESA